MDGRWNYPTLTWPLNLHKKMVSLESCYDTRIKSFSQDDIDRPYSRKEILR